MTLPNFLIVGAPKSGTNSLREYLRSHPDVFMPSGEVHYFDINFDKGIEWYQDFFKDWSGEKRIGEKTPSYMYDRKIAERIHKLNPKMKLIFLLRHPVDRAYSHYWHDKKAGRLTWDFDEVFLLKKGLDHEIAGHNLLKMSYYKKAISNYKKLFPPKQILLIKTEDLKNNRVKVLNKVYNFLDISKNTPINLDQEYNVGNSSRSELITRAVKKCQFIKGTRTPLRYIIGFLSMWNQKKLIQRFFRLSRYYHEFKFNSNKNYPEMEKETRQHLENIFKEDIEFWRKID